MSVPVAVSKHNTFMNRQAIIDASFAEVPDISENFHAQKKHPGFLGFLPLSKTTIKQLKENGSVIVNSECAYHLTGIPPLDL